MESQKRVQTCLFPDENKIRIILFGCDGLDISRKFEIPNPDYEYESLDEYIISVIKKIRDQEKEQKHLEMVRSLNEVLKLLPLKMHRTAVAQRASESHLTPLAAA